MMDELHAELDESGAELLETAARAILTVAVNADLPPQGRQQLCRQAADLYGVVSVLEQDDGGD